MSTSKSPPRKGSSEILKTREGQAHAACESPVAVRLLSKSQLRKALNLPSTRIVDEMMRRRRIPFIRLGHRTVRFDLDRVLEALSRLEVRAIGG